MCTELTGPSAMMHAEAFKWVLEDHPRCGCESSIPRYLSIALEKSDVSVCGFINDIAATGTSAKLLCNFVPGTVTKRDGVVDERKGSRGHGAPRVYSYPRAHTDRIRGCC